MASSGTYLWSPELSDCVDEAFERCRVDPGTLDPSHLISARRSINFMLAYWATKDNQDFRIDRLAPLALVQGTQNYDIDPDVDGRVIDVNNVLVRRNSIDTGIYPMSRDEWLEIPDKTKEGRPSRYFADKRTTVVTIYLWPVPENSTDTLIMDVMRKFQDAGYASDEPDIPYYMREAFVSSLAYWLGKKFAPEQILPRLMTEADDAFETANGAQRNRGDVTIVPSAGSGRRRGGRRR